MGSARGQHLCGAGARLLVDDRLNGDAAARGSAHVVELVDDQRRGQEKYRGGGGGEQADG